MPELNRLADQIRRTWQGEAWHGPSLQDLLTDVDDALASATPIPAGRSIADLALHIAVWVEMTRKLLAGPTPDPTPEEDWPSAESWSAARARIDRAHAELLPAVEAFDPARLHEIVPGKPYNYRFMLHGLAQHTTYHLGQIALTKSLARHADRT